MSYQARINSILFIIVIVLSLLAWYQPGLKQQQFQYLSTLAKNDVHSIHVERKDIGAISLKKYNDQWFLSEPYQLPANPLRVDTLMALLKKRSYAQFSATTQTLARYQLDKPPLSIWFNQSQFVLGGTDPVKRQRYVMNIDENIHSGKNTIHLINSIIYFQLRAALDTFISPNLLPPKAKINSIRWLDKELKRQGKTWQLSPDEGDVSSDSIVQLLQFWQHAQASKVEVNGVVNGVTLSAENSDGPQFMQSKQLISINISYPFEHKIKTENIQYLIIQDGKQLKLLRTDINVAYWISPQTLKLITEFFPLQENVKMP